jgi:hypothetical protein
MIQDLNKRSFDGYWINDTLPDCGELTVYVPEEKENTDHLFNGYGLDNYGQDNVCSRASVERPARRRADRAKGTKGGKENTEDHHTVHRTFKHNNLYRSIPIKREKMLVLSKNSNIHLYRSRQNRILLDSYTTPTHQ